MEQKDIDQTFAGTSIISGQDMHQEVKADIDTLTYEIMNLIKAEETTNVDGGHCLKITEMPEAAVEKIHAAAVLAKETAIYKRNQEKRPRIWETASFDELYTEMLYKVANAPTHFHMMGVPRLMMPVLSEALRRENGNDQGNA